MALNLFTVPLLDVKAVQSYIYHCYHTLHSVSTSYILQALSVIKHSGLWPSYVVKTQVLFTATLN